MRTRAGQITIEYFLLFAAIILVTMIGLSTFHADVSGIFKSLFDPSNSRSVVSHLPLDDGGPANPASCGQADPGDPVPPTDLP